MSNKIIRSLYEQRLAAWAATKSLQVNYENVPFTPPPGIYLRAFLLPAETDSQDLAGAHRAYLGVFKINIVAPISQGPGNAEQLAADLNSLFPVNLRLTKDSFAVQVITPASQSPAIQEDTRYVVPVGFSYRADTI